MLYGKRPYPPPSLRAGLVGAATYLLVAGPLIAQVDYRNLDAGHPVRTEDAYPIERYAFELLVGYGYHNDIGQDRVHALTPELSHGAAPNLQLGVAVPFGVLDNVETTRWGSAGPRVSVFYNIKTEGLDLPAMAVRTDLALPFGPLAGHDVRGSVTALATRSWGRTRAHLNVSLGLGSDIDIATVEPIPDWAVSLALDRSMLRRSLLVVGEVTVQRLVQGAAEEVAAGIGARWQLAPTFVLDAGLHRRLTADVGPDMELSIAFSHIFAFAGLMPKGTP